MKKRVNRITISAILVAFALSLFVIELLLPPFPFCPSAKIGLANVITLFMVTNRHFFKVSDCFFVLITRCVLSAIVTGRIMSVIFSLTGGLLALISMLFIARLVGFRSSVLVSISGAVIHNFAQMGVAILIYGTFSAVYYFPALFLTGVASGIITGLCISLINHNKYLYNFINSEVHSDGKRKN